LLLGMSMGQLLCTAMLCIGLLLYWLLRQQQTTVLR
jgi:prolipoprotein diacylglyceryltransferase